jgi:HPt (histidine-containing phosphotransfer) domain-containing protein
MNRIKERDRKGESSGSLSNQENLESELGPELYRELRADFLSQLTSQSAHLRTAARTGDVVGARSVAHQLKGTAPIFGASQLERLAVEFLHPGHSLDANLASMINEVDAQISRLQAAGDA